MLFNSVDFAIFLPLFFVVYWFLLAKNLSWQNLFLVFVSYLFYAWWDWRFLSLIVFSSIVDFLVGIELGKATSSGKRRFLLYSSLLVNLGLLGFFKYFNFFQAEFIAAFAQLGFNIHGSSLQVILPVGISFYTFQTLSYTIDVYRGKMEAVRDWPAFFAYVSFFPQLVAGPIERSTQLLPQFLRERKFNYDQASDGLRQILWGLFKKVVIADSCALIVNDIFNNYATAGTSTLMLGVILFAFQIYGDFSGYSDIAIGSARLFGFNLMRNFAYPYFARDLAEFWRRWHISLSTWFRDYVYIPLGGSKVNKKWKLARNVFIVFIISGFWHGANWTFLVWGFLHALFFLPLILFNRNRRHLTIVAADRHLPSIKECLQMASTFVLVCLSWIFFRAENLEHALAYLTQMFSQIEFEPRVFRKNIFLLLGILIMLGAEWLQRDKQHGFQFNNAKMPLFARAGIYVFTIFSILLFAPQAKSPFIYFQF